jgi:iron complex outermembrane receptor protein
VRRRARSRLARTALATSALTAIMAIGASAPGFAQDEEEGVERIVVTAEFRERDLQETPLAISAFSGDLLEDIGATNTTDLDMFVPNAVIQPLGAG